ncbi:MAG: putative amidoligase enzyme [Prokaryotic dsDNA virus sp.]|nr:MAG: putative amidoligase enzyme [Prokaryotic dsDNA virus sp.]|tara:strand:- start:3676 stop:4602 length:927 start_codon:yes stop_codon:yes gene_type:complete
MATIYYNNTRNQANNKTRYTKTGGMQYTFGVELETSRGQNDTMEQETMDNNLNVLACYDGSIRGREYVTGVLKGNDGMEQLEGICDALNNTEHEVDRRCGVHVHIGGANFNRAFGAMALRLACQIQDDIFEMLPESRRNNSYCPKIDVRTYKNTNFKNANKKIAQFVFGRTNLDKTYNKKYHLGRYPSTRYNWMNMVRCGSASNGETLEFRCHAGSLNFEKLQNWILVCMSIVRFIENNQSRIMKKGVTLLEILNEALPTEMRNKVFDYCNMRKVNFGFKPMRKHLYYKPQSNLCDLGREVKTGFKNL